MPPRQQITREKILDTAFALLREKGEAHINAREIAAAVGCSTQPLFSCFSGMDELRDALLQMARERYNRAVTDALTADNAFKATGKAYVTFAREEPVLFSLLFMNNRYAPVHTVDELEDNYEAILLSVQQRSGLSKEDSRTLYADVWIFTHGIAALLATHTADFSEAEVETLLTDAFIGIRQRLVDKRRKGESTYELH